MAFDAGPVAVQYRQKNFVSERDEYEARLIADYAKENNGVLIVNDYLDLAIEWDASGVHLGATDAPLERAFAQMKKDKIIGATVHNMEEYAAAERFPLDYIGIGPVFGTTSKKSDLRPLGLEALAAFCAISKFPVIAIGNINVGNIGETLAAGAYGVAVLSAFVCAEYPFREARRMLEMMEAQVV